MPLTRHRARRYPFHATIEVVDLGTETVIREFTTDLSLFGCHLNAAASLPAGTRVRLKISYGRESFAAFGEVVHARRNTGIGIQFTKIEPRDQIVLDRWLGERQSSQARR